MSPKKKQFSEKSTILIEKEVISLLKEAKEYPRQTYNELIRKMAVLFMEAKKNIVEEKEKKKEKENGKIKEFIEDSLLEENPKKEETSGT